jgi:hypothetical protein
VGVSDKEILLEATEFIQSMLGMGLTDPFLINKQTNRQSRCRDLVEARHLVRFYIRDIYGLSWTRIGIICSCNHATVIHSCGFVEDMSTFDRRFLMYKESISLGRSTAPLTITEKVRKVFKSNATESKRVSSLVTLFTKELEKNSYEFKT